MAAEHEELENAIAALVIGSAQADERQRLLAHLQACSSCRELAARLGRLTAVLPLEPEPVDPPPRLQGRVLAAVRAVDHGPAHLSRRQPLVTARPRWLRIQLPGARLGAVAAAVLAFLLGAGVGVGLSHGRQLGPAAPAPAQVQRYQLHGSGSMAGVQASAVYLTRDGLTLVDFKDMPQAPAGHVYELWLIRDDGRAVPAAVFAPEADGSKTVLVTEDLKGTRELAVTAEPGPDGSPAPTQQPQLSGAVS